MAKLKINRGTSYKRTLLYKKDGVATSLAGATIRFTVKNSEYDANPNDSSAVISKDITNGTADGMAEIPIDPSDTAMLEPGEYYYDIKVDEQSNGATVYKVDEGTIILDGSPTNRLA